MKKAKVSANGMVLMVWPWVKTMPDGRVLVKELPPQYRALRGKSAPECIIDVPDHVEPGFVWNGTEYAPRIKIPIPKGHSDLIEVLAEKLGITYDALMTEIMERKRAKYAAASKN